MLGVLERFVFCFFLDLDTIYTHTWTDGQDIWDEVLCTKHKLIEGKIAYSGDISTTEFKR